MNIIKLNDISHNRLDLSNLSKVGLNQTKN